MLPGEIAVLKKGVDIVVENNAGVALLRMTITRQQVRLQFRADLITKAVMLLSGHLLPEADMKLCREGQILCSVLNPRENGEWLEKARQEDLVLGLDLIPRITRTGYGYFLPWQQCQVTRRFCMLLLSTQILSMFMSICRYHKTSTSAYPGCRWQVYGLWLYRKLESVVEVLMFVQL